MTRGRLVIVHLFPDLLNLYGDRGNVATLVQRARWRGLDVDVRAIDETSISGLLAADIIFIGGGPDRLQIPVARTLERAAGSLALAIADGAALLAICGGFQNLGDEYRSPLVGNLSGPGLFDIQTRATEGATRLVGGVVAELEPGSPIAALGTRSAVAAGFGGQEQTLVGFENHSGQTFLGWRVRSLGQVPLGHGNNGDDGGEGLLALPGEGGLTGLRVGSYLHGPLLPRNPHLADFILASALARRHGPELAPLDDDAEWAAHAAFAARWSPRSGRRWRPRLQRRLSL